MGAGNFYQSRKKAHNKRERTIEATSRAVKAAKKKLKKDMSEAEEIAKIEKMRKIYWFEKFYWFISSDNYLIIGGHDMQQNEIIFKKYLDINRDLYVHANIHGAATVAIKNPTGNPVPQRTINEAGCFAACRSRAWENKVGVETYWVYGYQ